MKTLEANGARIPALGFGTWRLSGRECRDMVRRAVEHGYTHVDTAIMYENEREVGAGLADAGVDRDRVWVTTKVWPDEIDDGALQRALAGSLERLGLDHVDLVLVHWPSPSIPFERTARALDDVVAKGMTRHIGVSNFTIAQVREAAAVSPRPIVCNQIEHHPLLDQSHVRAACREAGMAVVGYCPLARGGALFAEPAIVEAARCHDRTPAQIVLRWHMEQEGCGAIPKTATPERMRENLAVFDFELSADEIAGIDALGARNERICDYAFSPRWDPPASRAA